MYVLLGMFIVWFGVHWGYVLGMSAKKAYKEGRLTTYWVVILITPIVCAVLLDGVFNYTFGWMFLKKPRPVLFSSTVQYHADHSDGWRWWLALWWAKQLNVFDTHIRIVPR